MVTDSYPLLTLTYHNIMRSPPLGDEAVVYVVFYCGFPKEKGLIRLGAKGYPHEIMIRANETKLLET